MNCRTPAHILSLCVIIALCSACAGPAEQPDGLPHESPYVFEDYAMFSERLLAGEAVDLPRLRRRWLDSPDMVARADALTLAPTAGDALALAPRLGLYAADLLALRAGAAMPENPLGAEQLVERVLEAILSSGDGSPESPWTVSSRGDALAVLTLQDRDVIGGYYHTSASGTLFLRLLARPHVGGPSREWVFDLSDVFASYQASMIKHRPGTRYSPLIHIRRLAQLGDTDAITSAAILTLESKDLGAQRAGAERLFAAAEAGNRVADVVLADQYRDLAKRLEGSKRDEALQQAAHGYTRAADSGISYANYRLGHMLLENGESVEGLRRLELAAAADNVDALRMLAGMHREGLYVAVDTDGVRDLYRKLHELEDVAGRYAYADWALMPADAQPDPMAIEALMANVAAGDVASIVLEGDLRALGRQLPRDYEQARVLWRKAALAAVDLDLVHRIARSLVHNPPPLADPKFAAEILEQWLTGDRQQAACIACYVTWAEALQAIGRQDAAAAAVTRALALAADARSDSDRDQLLALRDELAGGEIASRRKTMLTSGEGAQAAGGQLLQHDR